MAVSMKEATDGSEMIKAAFETSFLKIPLSTFLKIYERPTNKCDRSLPIPLRKVIKTTELKEWFLLASENILVKVQQGLKHSIKCYVNIIFHFM